VRIIVVFLCYILLARLDGHTDRQAYKYRACIITERIMWWRFGRLYLSASRTLMDQLQSAIQLRYTRRLNSTCFTLWWTCGQLAL